MSSRTGWTNICRCYTNIERDAFKMNPERSRSMYIRPVDDPAKVMIYVVYRDGEACDAHRDGLSRARHYQEAAGILVGASGIKCTVLEFPPPA